MQTLELHRDAFSSGQLGSKLWLCQELEKLVVDRPQVIWILGGWHGISAFLLFSRQNLPIKHVRSFDLDAFASNGADAVMEYWVWQSWKFKSFALDCNDLDYTDGSYGEKPDIVINTSVEHFSSRKWYDAIPSGTTVALQGNNMPHEDHVHMYPKLRDFTKSFPMKTCHYSGELEFVYPTWSFNRYMVIGSKD